MPALTVSQMLYKLTGTYLVVVTQFNEKVVFGKLICQDAVRDLYAVERSDIRQADYLLVPADVANAEPGRLKLTNTHSAKFDV